jgi:quercetin dioxygenase-like cupin family protein
MEERAMKGSTLVRRRLWVLTAASVWFLAAPAAMAQSAADPESLEWTVPPVLPPGALIAVVSGDPTAPGEFTLLVSMPNGYRLPPHFHPSYEHVEVREGTLLVGVGDVIDPKRTRALVAGDSATAPAGVHHFSIARGRTVVSATFMGPYTITYLRAEDAPRPRNFPFGY